MVSLQCISYLPSSPLEMFFQQFESKFRWIKRREGRGGSIAGGDINGPRNFSPKEKINTSYYAPFAFLLRVCSCESIEAWDVGKKVFFPVWFSFFLAFFFSLPLGRPAMNCIHGFFEAVCYYRARQSRNFLFAFERNRFRFRREIFSSLSVLLYSSKTRYTQKMSFRRSVYNL